MRVEAPSVTPQGTLPQSGVSSLVHPALVEPLSSQELRVLRLLVTGNSNPEIASELVVSVNTVKT